MARTSAFEAAKSNMIIHGGITTAELNDLRNDKHLECMVARPSHELRMTLNPGMFRKFRDPKA